MGERIACLGWGSLIWDPGELRVDGDWQHDGPKIKVEFVRRSDSGLLTLVFFNDAKPVCSQWIWMAAEDLDGAIDNLATREGRGNPIPRKYIGQWPNGDAEPRIIDLESWAEKQGTDYVIWTALPPKFRNPETGRFRSRGASDVSGASAGCLPRKIARRLRVVVDPKDARRLPVLAEACGNDAERSLVAPPVSFAAPVRRRVHDEHGREGQGSGPDHGRRRVRPNCFRRHPISSSAQPLSARSVLSATPMYP